ncbi:MAG: hypothetical protein U0350_49420 [Caldilineaceae bacterium]
MDDLFDDFPYFNNLHTRTLALGLAVLDSTIYYLSTAGPGTACKFIWSSLVSPNSELDAAVWGSGLRGAPQLQTAYKALCAADRHPRHSAPAENSPGSVRSQGSHFA